MKKIHFPFYVLIAALLVLSAGCTGGIVELGGSGGPCLVDSQCPQGASCVAGVCTGGEDVTAEVEPEETACTPSDEVCDGADNDCDGDVDEELGTSTCGVGACEVTVDNCVDGKKQTCVPGDPVDEVCDGEDNDCDGEVDQELGTTTCGEGACEVTVDNCVDGKEQACVPGDPVDEVCDGADNDCDGDLDEELGTTTCGEGACQITVDNCVDGKVKECVPGDLTDEKCDGIDNDCDGTVDQGLGTTTCGVGACEVTVDNCVDGKEQVCVPGDPVDEVCDGVDNDCDGEVDQELGTTTCGFGVCEMTVANCVDGVPQICAPLPLVTDELCNGLDDDCDGAVDQGLGTTTCGLGVCETTVDNCVEGVPQECTPLPLVTAELCNSLDDDCDGAVDQGLGTTTCGVGACTVTVNNCVEGVSQSCVPGPKADETCDGIDNDCDETTDEELGTTTCGVGACTVTVDNCVEGLSQSCVPGPKADETCDGIDNDCDEKADEELVVNCYDGPAGTKDVGVCKGGTATCLEGQWGKCLDQVLPIPELCDGKDNDCNGAIDNGVTCRKLYGSVVGVGGQPVPGAPVTLYQGECGTGKVLASVVADNNGHFEFLLADGLDVCVSTTPEGYVPTLSTPFTADTDRRVDLVVTTANDVPTSSICGVVFEHFEEPPLPSLAALVEHFFVDKNQQENGSDTTTPADGTFCFDALPFDPIWSSLTGSREGVGEDTLIYTDGDYTLSPSVTTVVDLHLFPCLSSLCVQVYVLDDQGQEIPLAGANVLFYAGGPDWGFESTGVTGEDGVYCFECVIPPEAMPEPYYAYLAVEGANVKPYSTEFTSDSPNPPFVLSKTGKTTAKVVLLPDLPLSFCGTVTSAQTGLPLAGASVQLAKDQTSNVVASANTDAQGNYCFQNVPAESQSYFLSAKMAGYKSQTKSSNAGDFQLIPGKTVDVDFALAASNYKVCIKDNFETTNLVWVATGTGEVSWNRRQNAVLVNQGIPVCISVSDAEKCVPGVPGCILCGNAQAVGCIPATGALPNSWEGQYSYWFGNPATGNYLPTQGQCSEGNGGSGGPSSGTLTSELFMIPQTGNTVVQFRSWWEIEGVDPSGPDSFDQMLVHIVPQNGSATLVGWMNPEVDYDSASSQGCTSGGLMAPPTWGLYEFDLTQFAGQLVQLRFTFNTKDGLYNGFRGWGIDDLAVLGESCLP